MCKSMLTLVAACAAFLCGIHGSRAACYSAAYRAVSVAKFARNSCLLAHECISRPPSLSHSVARDKSHGERTNVHVGPVGLDWL